MPPGRMVFDLLSRDAPVNVNNFVFLAREGFYRNGSFHRVVPDTLIQEAAPSETAPEALTVTWKTMR